MFEMVFPDGKRRGMAFDSPSHAKHGVFVTRAGSQIVGKDFDQMKRKGKLVYDDLSATNTSSGEPNRPFNPAASTARGKLDGALKAFCEATGLKHEDVADQLDELLDGHERERVRAHAESLGVGGAGKGALDKDDDEDDDDRLDQKVREILRGQGYDDEAVETMLAKHREAAVAEFEAAACDERRLRRPIFRRYQGQRSGL